MSDNQPQVVWRNDRDGFVGTEIGTYTTREGHLGRVLQQLGSSVVHVYRVHNLTRHEVLPLDTLVRHALARAYCAPSNSTKELDATLVNEMTAEVASIPAFLSYTLRNRT